MGRWWRRGDLNADGADDVLTAAADGTGAEVRVFSGVSGTYVSQSKVTGSADGLGLVNWNGQRAIGVLTGGALMAYSSAGVGESPTLLGQVGSTSWGGSGASAGGTPAGGAAGSLAGGSQETLTADWVFNISPPEKVTVTSTVTKGTPGYPDRYLWEYHLVNHNFDQAIEGIGAGHVVVYTPVADSIIAMGNSLGWSQQIGEAGDETVVKWSSLEPASRIPWGGGEGDFWFTTPAAVIVQGNGDARDPGEANRAAGNALVPGPTGDLVIIDSNGAEVAEAREENPGGWVSVNNDNDNYNFDPGNALSPLADLGETTKVGFENDLIKIVVKNLAAPIDVSGAFKLEWSSSKIKVWKSPDKDTAAGKGEVSSGVTVVAGQETPFWVEGMGLSAAAMDEEIRLVWAPDGAAAQDVDTVKFTVYEVTGVGNVPSYSKHVYKLRTPDTRLSTLSVVGTGDENQTQTYDESTHTTTRWLLWKEGKREGVYRATPDAQLPFWTDRKVNIVKITFDFTSPDPNEFDFGEKADMGPNPAVDPNPLYIWSSKTATPAFKARLGVVSIEGPGNNRGVRFVETGFVQIVKTVSLHGDYQTASMRITNSLADNKYYIDGNAATKPWYNRGFGISIKGEPDDTVTPINLTLTDTPALIPTNKEFLPNPGQLNDYVGFLSIVVSFETYVCVHTLEAVNDSDKFYTVRAAGNWTWDGSGFVDEAGGVVSYREPSQENPLTGSPKFSEVTDGRIVPREITEGVTANSRLPGIYSDPQPYTP